MHMQIGGQEQSVLEVNVHVAEGGLSCLQGERIRTPTE
jgi:hypothetical protein